jgi:autotransporter-associated beta strand protein
MSRFLASSLCAIGALFLLAPAVVAQTYTFTGSGMNANMSVNTNWVSNLIAPSGDPNLKIIFAGPFVNAFQDIANPLVVQDLQFNTFFQLQGNAVRMDNLGANPTITVSSSTDIFTPVNFNAPTTITSSPNGGINFYGAITGSNLTFSTGGFATYTISGAGSSLGGVNTVNTNVQLNVNPTGAFSGTFNVAGGYVQLQTANAFTAGTDVNVSAGGQLIVQGATTIDNLDVSGGNVTLVSNLTIAGGLSSSSGANFIGNNSGSLALGGPTTINVTSSGTDQLSINSQISTGSINKTGAGKLELSYFGVNNFIGTNTVSAGTLRGSAGTLGTVVNNSTIELTGGTFNTSQISGPGNVVISGGSPTYNVAQAYTGTTTIDGGSLSGFVTSLPALVTGVGAGGGVVFNDTTNVTNSSTIAGNLNVFKNTSGVLTMNGNSPYSGGTTLFGGGLAIGSDTAIGSGPLFIFTSTQTLEAIGSRTLANPLQIGAGVTFQGGGDFNFTDTTPKTLSGTILHNSTGNTTIAGQYAVQSSGVLTVAAGSLTLGDASIVNGFTSAGPVTVSGGTLTLKSLNFINLPTVTLAGGTLNVPNGYAIPLGAVLQGTGGVTGRVATANGSTIIASGNLTLGDSAHPAGVNLDGELYTNNNTVTLQDSNQAVLGSITDIGTATLDGALVATNGAVLNFGRNLVGRGQVQSNNTLADAVIVNGDANGDALATPLVFTGYVKGVGTFNNVAFSGTFSPGLSPALLTVGNTVLLPSNVLDIEIGGLSRGGQFDAFDVLPSSTMMFDGTFKVSLINAFNPALGDQFDIFNGTTTGVFSSFNLPALNAGLSWDTSLLYTQGIIQVVTNIPEPATLVPMGLLVGAALLKRRRA